MKRSDFSYDLPDELIALYPPSERRLSRLMTLSGTTGETRHLQFSDLPSLLLPGDVLVLNNTRVIPARIFGCKSSGGRIEILLERVLDERRALVHMRASKPPKAGGVVYLHASQECVDAKPALAEVKARHAALFELEFDRPLLPLLQRIGHMPLPPYIERADESLDQERYQTVYAAREGAVAAPTAGLHFDEAMLQAVREMGVDIQYVTLHVGAGTFQPVRVDDIHEHQMHAEWVEVTPETVAAIHAAKMRGGRVIAVGTTSVRCLESASADGELRPYSGDTRIFIYPGYRFRCVDALITNFHLSESTLIMLVSAFAGRANVMAAYREAIEHQYRFFSYGDAMFVLPAPCVQ